MYVYRCAYILYVYVCMYLFKIRKGVAAYIQCENTVLLLNKKKKVFVLFYFYSCSKIKWPLNYI